MIENTHNYLATVFGYPMHLPNAPTTRRHYTSTTGSWGPRYVPPKEPTARVDNRKKPEFSATQMKMLEIVKKSSVAMTALEISKKAKCCHNHASLSMVAFFKKGFVKRKLINSGRHRWYIYHVEQIRLDSFNKAT